MNDSDRERLSAYLDDEVSPAERARVTRELSRQPAARRRMGRYRLIGDALGGELPRRLVPGFAARVRAAILKEEIPPAIPAWRRNLAAFWDWFLHPAPLAASGGALAVLVAAGLWWGGVLPPPDDGARVVRQEPPRVERAGAEVAGFDTREHEQLLSYLAAHAEVEPRALMPYAQLVGYEE